MHSTALSSMTLGFGLKPSRSVAEQQLLVRKCEAERQWIATRLEREEEISLAHGVRRIQEVLKPSQAWQTL